MEQTDPPAKVASNDQLGLVPERDTPCPGCNMPRSVGPCCDECKWKDAARKPPKLGADAIKAAVLDSIDVRGTVVETIIALKSSEQASLSPGAYQVLTAAVKKRDVVGLLRGLERHGEDNIWRTAKQAREEIESLRANAVRSIDDGALWSWVRSVMAHGADIHQDYERNKSAGYENYSARLDAAAAARTEELLARLFGPNVRANLDPTA